ncbi:cytochrome c peroxidase [Leptospira sp. 96542]|nr:cytochrome c peroxidase [Leptospira sp. 96542]
MFLQNSFRYSLKKFIFIIIFLLSNLFCNKFKESKKENTDLLMTFLYSISNDIELQALAKEQIGILPSRPPGSEFDTNAQIQLGNKIFRDNTLSLNQVQACITCHPLDGNSAGMDRQSTSRGTFGQIGKRNTPTILNVGYLPILFWDGRKDNLFDQAVMPFLDPLEMALPSETELLNRLQNNTSYTKDFANAFPNSPNVSIESLKKALSAFERSLVSKSRLDDFLEWNLLALSTEEKEGLKIFLSAGCTNCHNGNLFGGSKFKQVDSVHNYNPNDLGRYEFTNNDADKKFFRAPSLRNVSLTAPYFHDGSVRTLKEAVTRMNLYNLNQTLSNSEIDLLVQFLRSLSDKTKSN